jgi:hypothetical protein
MRESLRKVPQLAFCNGIIFFRQQPNIVTNCEQALKNPHSLLTPPLKNVIVGQPKWASV